ncbi:hypothetical protein MBLNU230_g2690t1 [Neophaeotheca triangularis]
MGTCNSKTDTEPTPDPTKAPSKPEPKKPQFPVRSSERTGVRMTAEQREQMEERRKTQPSLKNLGDNVYGGGVLAGGVA